MRRVVAVERAHAGPDPDVSEAGGQFNISMNNASGPNSSVDQRQDDWPADGLEWLGRCPVCHSSARSVLHSGLRDRVFFCAPGAWTLYACQDCELGYLDPRPTPATIALAYSSYFTHHPSERPAADAISRPQRWRRSFANGYRNWRYGTADRPANRLGVVLAHVLPASRRLLDLELRHLPRWRPGARVLDVGAGDGTFLQWAFAAGWDAVGVDPDPVAVAAARARKLKVHLGTIQDVPTDCRFDMITANHVIEHVHDPRAFLEHARDLLKPGGTLWLDTPNLSSVGHRVFGPAWLGLDPPRHLVLFTRRALRNLLSAAGFRIVRQLPRPEVCRVFFAASERIAKNCRNPLSEERPHSVRVRLRAWPAEWRGRLDPERAEFLTILATNAA